MKPSLRISALAMALLTIVPVVGADAQITATHVAGNVYMLEGQGGNIGVSLGDDGILIIDDQFARLADKIRAALKDLGTGKLKFVLNTHHHGDHTGGNAIFGKEATIVAHTNVFKRLSADDKQPREALPVITFDDSVSVRFNGEEIFLKHFPHGHTDTDSIVYFKESKVVHMGDHFFSGAFPFIDTSNGGTVKGYVRNVGAAIEDLADDVKIIPGHGPLSTKADLEAFHSMLVDCIGIVEEQVKAGKSLDDAKAQGMPEKYDAMGNGFINTDRWITILYNDLKG